MKKVLIVGGNFGDTPKPSSIVEKMKGVVANTVCVNGGTLDDLKNIDLNPYELIIWVPNISNEVEKIYPKKPLGSTLICSKVMREGYIYADAISRIFKMNANGVIAIDTTSKSYTFRLMDALGNFYLETTNINLLVLCCFKLSDMYDACIRQHSEQISDIPLYEQHHDIEALNSFMEINRKVADKSAAMGGRYFGNCSTRCQNMFPSARMNDKILVSPRNFNKDGIYPKDMIFVEPDIDIVKYNGTVKPSVDTPIQVNLYHKFDRINFMIHGHYYIYGAPMTENYYPCGDLREVDSISEIISKTYDIYSLGAINLRNHGFLLYSNTFEEMQQLVEKSIFVKRNIGYEKIKGV